MAYGFFVILLCATLRCLFADEHGPVPQDHLSADVVLSLFSAVDFKAFKSLESWQEITGDGNVEVSEVPSEINTLCPLKWIHVLWKFFHNKNGTLDYRCYMLIFKW